MKGRTVSNEQARTILGAYQAELVQRFPLAARRRRGRGLITVIALRRLNRATRRALGERGDAHLHPLVATKAQTIRELKKGAA